LVRIQLSVMILKYKNIIRSANIKDEGVILSIGDGIVKASGLRNVTAGEMLGTYSIAGGVNSEDYFVGFILLLYFILFLLKECSNNEGLYDYTVFMTIKYFPMYKNYNVHLIELLIRSNVIYYIINQATAGKTLFELTVELPGTLVIDKHYIINELNRLGVNSDIEIKINYTSRISDALEIPVFTITNRTPFEITLILSGILFSIVYFIIEFFFS